jgi:hypothetical protein
MSSVQIEQKSYEMPPRDGFTVTHFITVADIDRSADFYEKVFGGRILSRGCVWAHSDREYLADCQRRGRAHPGQAEGDALRPRRPG